MHPACPFLRTIRLMRQCQFDQVIYERSLSSTAWGKRDVPESTKTEGNRGQSRMALPLVCIAFRARRCGRETRGNSGQSPILLLVLVLDVLRFRQGNGRLLLDFGGPFPLLFHWVQGIDQCHRNVHPSQNKDSRPLSASWKTRRMTWKESMQGLQT